ncbi:uncharacterized protein LOC135431090 [Drosophila montana]|uniref:uncharacterized protein LOC135431090 n=1 Tax=Drosophila montana TaxID=40370 RepID=UPI00313CE5CB
MYRQVLVSPVDRKFQYIFWRASPDADLQTFELNTVTYGTASAPYLAVRSLQYLADLHVNEFPIGASIVKSSFYVDDLLCGANELIELQNIKHEVTEILRRGHFPLVKWHSNHPAVRNDESVKDLNLDENAVTSALGVAWDQRRDVLLFEFKPKKLYSTVTKRTILSTASSLFDPLGLLAPIIIVSKIIIQELWLLKLAWDESVPQSLLQAWRNCVTSLKELSSISVPRFCLQAELTDIQLHAFCDASIRAYGCCVYVRSTDSYGNVQVQLLTAKSRVAPVKKLTLPRLELSGAQLLSKLYTTVKNIFIGKPHSAHFWSDSQIVLHWLQQHSITLSTFVGNRVSIIQDQTAEDGKWRHVPSKLNPADIVSRGCPANELQQSIWFTGPAFLRDSETQWPCQQFDNDLDMDIIDAEKRKSTFAAIIESNSILDWLNGTSSYIRALRVMAYMFRFYHIAKKEHPVESSPPCPEELRHALHCIIRIIQQHYFKEDLQLLRKQRDLKSNLKFLSPFIDDSSGYELIKVGGRLEHADISPLAKGILYLFPRNRNLSTIMFGIFTCAITMQDQRH